MICREFVYMVRVLLWYDQGWFHSSAPFKHRFPLMQYVDDNAVTDGDQDDVSLFVPIE